MDRKAVGRNDHGPSWAVIAWIARRRPQDTCQDTRFPRLDLNSGLPKYDVGNFSLGVPNMLDLYKNH